MEAQYSGWKAIAMMRVCVVCEGQTEEEFVLAVLAPALIGVGINLIPEMISTSPGHKGGALRFERVKRHLRNTLRQASAPSVTTLFDLYRLDKSFPDFELASNQKDISNRLAMLNSALHRVVVAEASCRPERFLPFIQPYEFEALLFSDVTVLTATYETWHPAASALLNVRNAAPTPEHINEHPDTKPSAHLERELKLPRYKKALHGPIAAQNIGLTKIAAECKFFAGWLKSIRQLV